MQCWWNTGVACQPQEIDSNLMLFSPLKVWINQGDIILIGLRDYQDAKADVILRYNPDEARNLKAYGELPETGQHIGLVSGSQLSRTGISELEE